MDSLTSSASQRAPDLPGYQILERVGEGGTGEVFRARQLRLERVVAVKRLRAAGGATLESARAEALHLASLSHPNIVGIYDCLQDGDSLCLVMEFVEGSTLRERVRPGTAWHPEQALAALNTIAAALSFIHARGLLHLDLKPENVLCGPNGVLKLSDFGLALFRDDAGPVMDLATVQGSIDYCAPEQRFGLPLDPRTDLFALATIAYELLTGQLPGRVYVPCSKRNPRLPPEIDEVLRAGLARDLEGRPESVEAFRQSLNDALRVRRSRPALLLSALATSLACLWICVDRSHSPAPPAVAPSERRCWLVGEDGRSLPGGGLDEFRAAAVAGRWEITQPDKAGNSLPLPDQVAREPEPMPALVVRATGKLGCFHPWSGWASARTFLEEWDRLARTGELSSPANLIRGGGFDRAEELNAGDRRGAPWIVSTPGKLAEGDRVEIAVPADQAGNAALSLTRTENSGSPRGVLCFQWVKKPPSRDAALVVLRFRARSESGQPQLSVRPTVPLLPPADDPAAERHLREQFPAAPQSRESPDGPLPVLFRSQFSIKPDRQWRNYVLAWEPFPYHSPDYGRNVEILLLGHGQAWVDDVELFEVVRPPGRVAASH